MAEQTVASVTGISSGIGQAIAAVLAKERFRTLCHGGNQPSCAAVRIARGGSSWWEVVHDPISKEP
jgi:NAD(P)-dependent dehydrogenase (short-subunit alcohol dehydrogenase family)